MNINKFPFLPFPVQDISLLNLKPDITPNSKSDHKLHCHNLCLQIKNEDSSWCLSLYFVLWANAVKLQPDAFKTW